MSGCARLRSRSGLAAAPTRAARCPAPERRKPAARPGPWLLLGLLLAVSVPAHGFEGQEQAPPSAAELALYGSGAPTYANWVVLDATGIAAWRADGDTRWQPFTRGEVLPAGCEIETGSDGEVTLVAGGDQLTIAPQGRLIVPIAQPGQDRRLRHERGRILVQIESRAARDVRVDTPLLSLGIKGTTFEVLVEATQDSVLVHDGDVEVTTPGEGDAVDLGTRDGLRQSAAPGSEPARFNMPPPEGPAGAADGPVWRLPATPPDPGQTETDAAPVAPDSAQGPDRVDRDARGGSARAKPATSDGMIDLGQLDELASSWDSIAIAAVGFVILAIPVLALLQHLREQWFGRPKPKGERRRQLVRG